MLCQKKYEDAGSNRTYRANTAHDDVVLGLPDILSYLLDRFFNYSHARLQILQSSRDARFSIASVEVLVVLLDLLFYFTKAKLYVVRLAHGPPMFDALL